MSTILGLINTSHTCIYTTPRALLPNENDANEKCCRTALDGLNGAMARCGALMHLFAAKHHVTCHEMPHLLLFGQDNERAKARGRQNKKESVQVCTMRPVSEHASMKYTAVCVVER